MSTISQPRLRRRAWRSGKRNNLPGRRNKPDVMRESTKELVQCRGKIWHERNSKSETYIMPDSQPGTHKILPALIWELQSQLLASLIRRIVERRTEEQRREDARSYGYVCPTPMLDVHNQTPHGEQLKEQKAIDIKTMSNRVRH